MIKLYAKEIKKNELEQSTMIKISKMTILASIIFLMILIITTKANSEIGAPPVGGGDSESDWIIENGDIIIREDQEIRLKGNLTIENGGSLTFKHVTLIMNCLVDGEFSIIVEDGGEFYIFDYDNNPETSYDRSNITADNIDYEFKFLVNSGAVFEMRNSELSECGYRWGDDGRSGLTIKTDNSVIENSTFYNNYNGIYLDYSDYNQLLNNTIINNNGDGIYLYNSNDNQFIHNTITNNDDAFCLEYQCNNNLFIDNTITNNDYIFWVDSQCNNNQILNNTASNNWCNIYLLDSCNNNLFINNTFCNNDDGIWIEESNDNQFINNNISNNWDGIWIEYESHNNLLINNTISHNDGGIYVDYQCNNNQIINNTVSNNEWGIAIWSSENTKMRDNIINNNEYNFEAEGGDISEYYHDIDTSNTINGKPIYYIIGQNNLLFDNSMDIGYLGLISCSDVTVKNLLLSNNGQGILFVNTTDSIIENCDISNNYNGIYFDLSSDNNQITDNSFTNNRYGINIRSSKNNTIINNNVYSNTYFGIKLSNSDNNQIINNDVYSNNYYGIDLSKSKDNKMRDNIINDHRYNFGVSGSDISNYYHDIDTSNTINGKPIIYIIENHNFVIDEKTNGGYIGLISCSKVTIKNLILNNNKQGILFGNTTDSIIENCEIINNYYGIYLSFSSNNNIINNNIDNNSQGIRLESSNGNQFINNNGYNNSNGIRLESSNDNQFIDNIVTRKGGHWYNTAGIYIGTSSHNNNFSNNKVNYIKCIEIRSGNNNFFNNKVNSDYMGIEIRSDNNNLSNNTITIHSDGTGISINGKNNILSNNNIHSDRTCIEIISDNNNILNNTISSNETSIKINGDNNILLNNIISSRKFGILFSSSFDNTVEKNTFILNSNGIRFDKSSSRNTVMKNTFKSNRYGIADSSSSGNTFTQNIISENINDLLGDSNNVYSFNEFTNNLNSKMIDVSINNRIPDINDLVEFTISVFYPIGYVCDDFTYLITTRPQETITTSVNENNISGYFTIKQAGFYSLIVNITDSESNIVVRNFVIIVNPEEKAVRYYLREVNATHGQPTGTDAGSLLLTPPEAVEIWKDNKWVQNSPDQLTVPTPTIISNVDVFCWYKMGSEGYIGVKRYAYLNINMDFKEPVPSASDYTWINRNISVNYPMDYPWSWYWLSVKLVGESSSYPYWKTNAITPSYVNIIYKSTSTPEIKSLSNNEIKVLSATSYETDTRNATIYLKGTGETNLIVQMPDTSISYEAYFDGIKCDNENCTFTQSNGELNFNIILTSEHNLTITTITIDRIPKAKIDEIKPNPANEGEEVWFYGNGTDDGEIQSYEWESSIEGIISNEKSFNNSDLSNGTHTIFFKVQDDNNVWSEVVSTTLIINGIPKAIIEEIKPKHADEGETIYFNSIGTDDGTISKYEWSSSIDGFLSNKKSFSLSNLSFGSHTIYLKVMDNFDVWSEPVTDKLIINQKYDIELSCKYYEKETKPGEITSYTIIVTNLGNGKDTISISMSDPPVGWQVLFNQKRSEKKITLEPSQSETINLTVEAPEWDKYKAENSINITGESEGNVYDHITITTTVNFDYDINLTISDTSKEINPGKKTSYLVKITNYGNCKTTIFLELFKVPNGWTAELDLLTFELKKNEFIEVFLEVFGPKNAENGDKANIVIVANVGDKSWSIKTSTTIVKKEGSDESFNLLVPILFLILVGVLISAIIMLRGRSFSDYEEYQFEPEAEVKSLAEESIEDFISKDTPKKETILKETEDFEDLDFSESILPSVDLKLESEKEIIDEKLDTEIKKIDEKLDTEIENIDEDIELEEWIKEEEDEIFSKGLRKIDKKEELLKITAQKEIAKPKGIEQIRKGKCPVCGRTVFITGGSKEKIKCFWCGSNVTF